MKNITLALVVLIIGVFVTFIYFNERDSEGYNINTVIVFDKYVGNIVIEEDPSLNTLGRQQTVGGVCFIKLKKYPICLQHEVRHCIEGNFHEGKPSDEDCFE